MAGLPKRIFYIVVAVVLMIVVGTVGFKITGGGKTSFLDALFMTAITMSTAGYGDVIGLDDKPWGKVFTIIFNFASIALIAYLATSLATYVIEGELRRVFRKRSMEKRLKRMKHHYIICGIGMVGLYIVNELHQTKRHQIAIDLREGLDDTLKTQNIHVDVIIGDATENEILEKAMIREAKGVFATTNSDNDNIVIALTARQLNPSIRVVCRCNDTKNIGKMERAGADSVVALDYTGGLRMVSEMIRPHVTTFLDKMVRDRESAMRVEEVHVPEDSPYLGKPVGEIDFRRLGNILLVAVRRENGTWIYNPYPVAVLEKNMSLIVMAHPDERELLEKMVGAAKRTTA